MIAGEALAAWLADRPAQKRSLDAVEDSAREWSRHPLMGKLDAELHALDDPTPAHVIAAARRFMDRVDEIAAMMSSMMAASAADPFYRPPFHPLSSEIHNGILLFHHPLLSLALGVTGVDMLAAKKAGPRGAASVGFTGQVSLYRYLKAGGATVSLWEAPEITAAFVSSEAGTCRITGRRKLEDGDELLIDGRRESFIIEHASSEMIYFQAVVHAQAAPVSTEYDGKSMALIGASSTDEASSRVQMMVSLLRTMAREDALPLIVDALESPHFYTRWHIMRELLAMDADAAEAPLRRMAESDPHPEVRATARRTLALFFVAEGDAACRA
jgi:hypothetical protein